MNLDKDQKVAIIHISQQMVEADGHASPNEAERIDMVLKELGISSKEEQRLITTDARKIKPKVAYSIIKDFPLESKKRVVGLLQSIMKVDNEVDSREEEQLKRIAVSCDLPLKEAE